MTDYVTYRSTSGPMSRRVRKGSPADVRLSGLPGEWVRSGSQPPPTTEPGSEPADEPAGVLDRVARFLRGEG